MAEYYGKYPCHRVVNHAGRLVPGWADQAELLHNEGVFLKDTGHVDLKKYQWEC
jgi:methylated-DNA-protein-cysteine methyltransferase-like protein